MGVGREERWSTQTRLTGGGDAPAHNSHAFIARTMSDESAYSIDRNSEGRSGAGDAWSIACNAAN